MVSNLVVAQEEHTRDLPMDPVVFGLVTFVFLLVLVFGVLMFGKGRPHA
jgi:hypothetical protein